jgi:hypothetical protein
MADRSIQSADRMRSPNIPSREVIVAANIRMFAALNPVATNFPTTSRDGLQLR